MSADPPAEVRAAFDRLPPDPRATCLGLRRLIFDRAAALGVGPLTETLKWGQPAYLTAVTGSGTTLRLGALPGEAGHAAVFVPCGSRLADTFRDRAPGLRVVGNRAVMVPTARPPGPEVTLCIDLALTYHRWT